MSSQITKWLSPAKINLFLHVTGKRDDGYHDLQTVFQFIDLYDDIEIEINDELNNTGRIELKNAVLDIAEEDNLAIKAAKLLQAKSGSKHGASISIEKRIPAGAGLGGGSSNAATVLIALNRLWQLNYSREDLMSIGASLGADVPVFIFGQNAFAEGIGEKLYAVELPQMHYWLAVPDVHCNTASLFAAELLKRDTPQISLDEFNASKQLMLSFDNDALTHNDFSAVVYQQYPQVEQAANILSEFAAQQLVDARLKSELTQKPQIFAKMTGTGAGVFVRIEPDLSPSFQAVRQAMQEKMKKTQLFCIKSLSIHPHW